MIKEISDGMGNINFRKIDSTFSRTNREYEFKKALPNNGPSPHPNQFSPKFNLVQTLSPRPPNLDVGKNLPRFIDKDYSDNFKKNYEKERGKNHPRFD